MKFRFFDIVAENNEVEYPVSSEFVLDLPEHSTETAVDRQEFLGMMFDSLIAASGLNVCSFSSEQLA